MISELQLLTDPSAPVPLSGKALGDADRQCLVGRSVWHRTKFGCITNQKIAVVMQRAIETQEAEASDSAYLSHPCGLIDT
ncbi:MAG: hypothetical protein JW384_01823 [Nitrosomonadaceae bacterium]|nr:hypothetical protein [Nitrosomonadaceae bacterium]